MSIMKFAQISLIGVGFKKKIESKNVSQIWISLLSLEY